MSGGIKHVVQAQFPSRCAVCDEKIDEGDPIVYLDNEGDWVHEDCAPEGESAFE